MNITDLLDNIDAKLGNPPAAKPAAPESKEQSRVSAFRHGLTSRTVVMPWEDREAYQIHCDAFLAEFQPVGLLENHLVQTLADILWRLPRLASREAELLTLGEVERYRPFENVEPEAQGPLAQAAAWRANPKAFATLSVYEQRLNRSLGQTMKELRATQAERQARELRHSESNK